MDNIKKGKNIAEETKHTWVLDWIIKFFFWMNLIILTNHTYKKKKNWVKIHALLNIYEMYFWQSLATCLFYLETYVSVISLKATLIEIMYVHSFLDSIMFSPEEQCSLI